MSTGAAPATPSEGDARAEAALEINVDGRWDAEEWQAEWRRDASVRVARRLYGWR